jgi:acetyl esterase/lipase
MIAWLEKEEGRARLKVSLVAAPDKVICSCPETESILDYIWINRDTISYIVDPNGSANNKLYVFNLPTNKISNIKTEDDWGYSCPYALDDEHDFLVTTSNQRDRKYFDLYKIDLKTLEPKLMATGKEGAIYDWILDEMAQIRGAVIRSDDQATLAVGAPGSLETVMQVGAGEVIASTKASTHYDFLLVATNGGRDTLGLVKVSGRKPHAIVPLIERPVDLASIAIESKTGEIAGVATKLDRLKWEWFNDSERARYAHWAKLAGDWNLTAISKVEDAGAWIFSASGDRNAATYYLWNEATSSGSLLFSSEKVLPAGELAPVTPVQFKARDGLEIHGYVTLPLAKTEKVPPFVVLVHGGPCDERDDWEYDAMVQFLANRGYGVFQVNYRGSAGFGKRFARAGDKQWGQAMQNDITDGVRWLIANQYASPEKIAIMGASYGGYAALCGATFTPDLYCAAIDICGPSNLFSFMESIPPYWEPLRAELRRRVGDMEKDKEMLRAGSPLFHVDKIKIPVFIAQGANDPRVNRRESEQMVDALRARGLPVEYLLKENEGHGFSHLDNLVELFDRIALFLDHYVKEATKPVGQNQ